MGVAPLDYGPVLLRMPFGSRLAADTLPSGVLRSGGFRSALAVSVFRLRARLGFSIPSALPRPARHYPRLWIWRPSFERQRDLNPPDQNAAQRTLWASPTSSDPFIIGVRPSGLPDRPTAMLAWAGTRGLPVLAHGVSSMQGSPTAQGRPTLAYCTSSVLPSASLNGVGTLDRVISRLNALPARPLSTLRRHPYGRLRMTRGQRGSLPFSVRLFHPLLHAGFSRRTLRVVSAPSAPPR